MEEVREAVEEEKELSASRVEEEKEHSTSQVEEKELFTSQVKEEKDPSTSQVKEERDPSTSQVEEKKEPTTNQVEEVVCQKLSRAQEFKEKGNLHFKQKELNKAMKSYHSGLLYIKGIDQDMNPNTVLGRKQHTPKLPAKLRDQVDGVSADLHNNIAACLLKQEAVRYERVVECCQQVTTLQPSNVKGWYRLGLAHHHLRDFDAAKAALKEANTAASGQDLAVRKLLATVEQEIKKQNQKFNDLFKNSLLAKST